jgi:hypothetical protein
MIFAASMLDCCKVLMQLAKIDIAIDVGPLCKVQLLHSGSALAMAVLQQPFLMFHLFPSSFYRDVLTAVNR